MKTIQKILFITGIATLLLTSGCIILPGRHHTTVVAPAPVIVEPVHP